VRLLAVAEHYRHFGGVSPINAQNRALITALQSELDAHGPRLKVYWGNRNWHPLLPDALREMAADGVGRAIAFFTSAYSSYSGCRQYRENIAAAQAEVGAAPAIDKLRVFYNHPGFIEPMVENVRAAINRLPAERRSAARLIFTAHSIPLAMASGSRYVAQLQEASRLVAEGAGRGDWILVYQSRSGSPAQPWLEPDVNDYLRQIRGEGATDAVVVPIGFISDHMEILYDLDTEAQQIAAQIGLHLVRAATVGTHPKFVAMIRELILERIGEAPPRALGSHGPSHDVCAVNCCLPVSRRPDSSTPS
jgi:ferrochelatase